MKGTVVVLSLMIIMYRFFWPSFDLFHQCFTFDCPSMLLPEVIVCEKIFTFLSKVCFFLK